MREGSEGCEEEPECTRTPRYGNIKVPGGGGINQVVVLDLGKLKVKGASDPACGLSCFFIYVCYSINKYLTCTYENFY